MSYECRLSQILNRSITHKRSKRERPLRLASVNPHFAEKLRPRDVEMAFPIPSCQ